MMSEVRKPEAGDTVNIILPNRTITAEVVGDSPQADLHSPYAPAVIVKVDDVLNTFSHKSRSGAPSYWEWPADSTVKDYLK
jgi:hypothetical protein